MDYRYEKGQLVVQAKRIGDAWILTSQDGEWISPLEDLNWSLESQKQLIQWVADRFPPFAHSKEQLPKIFLKSEIKDKAIFFGGSFNPWHMGHRVSLDLCPLGPIIVVPDQNPWKEIRTIENIWKYYLDICRKLEETEYSVYPGFLLLNKPNPTIDWISQIQIESKYLLIGEDSFLAIEKWKDSFRLLSSLAGLFVSPRGKNSEEVGSLRLKLKKLYPHLIVQFLDHHDYEDLSSTEIRKK